ncbi:phosphoheptose isomerase [Chitinophaga rupis]|uniref:Phosphoheptose isomerase n=1 Tax=Chitinophaga rupis TaxID=573321 RepID=A0A1H7QYD8_9BACT|nr:glycosyltransferase [Chitinophaga rupis]SEL52665.1 phosphoheptose isomerase [Chitinophaga rupis]
MKSRIAFISEHASPLSTIGGVDAGGQNVYVGELARQLVKKGYEVDIFTRRENAQLPQCLQWATGVRIVHVDAGPAQIIPKEQLLPYMAAFRDNMIRFIQEHGITYKLVHANFFMSAQVAVDLKQMLHIPFVVTFHALGHIRRLHQGEQDKFPAERITIEKEAIRQADCIIAECPQDKEDLMQYYQAPANKISIIPGGVNPDEMYPVDKQIARMRLKLAPQEIVLLQLGRMVPRKGVDNVIAALPKLKYTGAKVRLIIVGGEDGARDPEIARLKQLAKDLGVAACVTFAGQRTRDELKYYYAAADLFITTPWYEPFGITPLEAMACGTPVIGANVGGIKYSVLDGKTGLLVPPQNPDALAEKISELLLNRTLLQEMSANAVKRVQTLFTWQRVAHLMNNVYEKVILNHSIAVNSTLPEDLSLIDNAFENLVNTITVCKQQLRAPLQEAARQMYRCLLHGKKILVCGNGGSASQSQHFAAELVGRFEIPDRPGMPAIALTADSAVLTAWSNDYGYDQVFSRQVQALGRKGDILLCLSTSGNSNNILLAMEAAHQQQMTCIALLGKDGGPAADYADIGLIVPSGNTARIQELHMHLLHVLCTLVERKIAGLYANNEAPAPKTGALAIPVMNG